MFSKDFSVQVVKSRNRVIKRTRLGPISINSVDLRKLFRIVYMHIRSLQTTNYSLVQIESSCRRQFQCGSNVQFIFDRIEDIVSKLEAFADDNINTSGVLKKKRSQERSASVFSNKIKEENVENNLVFRIDRRKTVPLKSTHKKNVFRNPSHKNKILSTFYFSILISVYL